MNIIVVRYKNKEVEDRCLASVRKFTDLSRHTLTVFDNEPENINLGKLWNTLIEESEHEIICLLNSDTVLTESFERMADLLDDRTIGAVGPRTDHCGTLQKDMEKGSPEDINDLSGFCYLFRKSVWEKVGGFPEDFPFYGQESVFNRKLQDRGYRLVVDRRVFVHHDGGSTYKKTATDDHRKYGAFHYWNYVARLKKLRDKIPSGTVVAVYGYGDAFPLARGMKQALADFFGSDGLGFQEPSAADNALSYKKPDIYITTQTKHDESWEIARRQKELGVKTALYFNDLRSPLLEWPYKIDVPNLKDYFSALFICAEGYLDHWKHYGIPVHHLPQGTIQQPLPPQGTHYEVVHIGDVQTEFHTERNEILKAIPHVNLNEIDRAKRIALSHESFGIYRSSDYALSVSHDVRGYTSDRLYHILGSGGVALAYNPGGIPFEHGKHLLWFRTPDEAKHLIGTTTEAERETIRENAWVEAQTNHLYKDRLIELLTKL